jgi:hypothetical protein
VRARHRLFDGIGRGGSKRCAGATHDLEQSEMREGSLARGSSGEGDRSPAEVLNGRLRGGSLVGVVIKLTASVESGAAKRRE